jgi:hypothetical protein
MVGLLLFHAIPDGVLHCHQTLPGIQTLNASQELIHAEGNPIAFAQVNPASFYPPGDNQTILVYFRLPHGYPRGCKEKPVELANSTAGIVSSFRISVSHLESGPV